MDDPISTACDADDLGHGRGMSQEGASRWARGHQCSYDGASTLPGNPAGSDWSVTWAHAEYILAHYYPTARIADVDNPSLVPTSYARWNPLRITWGTPDNQPPAMDHGGSYPVAIQAQNTGLGWLATHIGLSYHWSKAGFGEIDSSNRDWVTVTVLNNDPPYTFTLTIDDIPNWGPGAYTLKFDMVFSSGSWFSESSSQRPTY